MRPRFRRFTKPSCVLLVAVLACTSLSLVPASNAGEPEDSVGVAFVGKGQVRHHSWEALVLVERGAPSICLEAAVMAGNRLREDGVGYCAYPAVKRGILLVVANRARRDGERPWITAVAGAFNPAVRKVVAETFTGRQVVLPIHRLRTDARIGVARRFRYLAFGVSGPWCARRVKTYDAQGRVLWTDSFLGTPSTRSLAGAVCDF